MKAMKDSGKAVDTPMKGIWIRVSGELTSAKLTLINLIVNGKRNLQKNNFMYYGKKVQRFLSLENSGKQTKQEIIIVQPATTYCSGQTANSCPAAAGQAFLRLLKNQLNLLKISLF